jgi:hypothetical protein
MSVSLTSKLKLSRLGVYILFCPGCKDTHYAYTTESDLMEKGWQFNKDINSPTFTPSFRHYYHKCLCTDEEMKVFRQRIAAGETVDIPKEDITTCHYNVTDGKLMFHGDSSHHLAGQTVDMIEFPPYKEYMV